VALHREWAECQILIYVVDGHVEAGMVRQVENVKGVLQRETFRQLRFFYDGHIGAFLPGLPEDVSLSTVRDEIGFKRITRRNRAPQVARLQ
jgi:hypothetical protein